MALRTKKIISSALLVAGLILGFTGTANASQQLYRYVNDRGETVIATSVPREIAAKRGYEILNQRGRVLEVVNPELSYEARQAHSFKKET